MRSKAGRGRQAQRSPLLTAARLTALCVALPLAGLLTVLRLLQPETGWAIRLVAFSPVAAPLYAVLSLALVAGAVAAARSRRRASALRWSLAALISGVLLLVHLSWLAPLALGEVPAVAPAGARLRVLTANVLNGATTPDQVADLAARTDADVVVLQEVTVAFWAKAQRGRLLRDYPHAAGAPGPDERAANPETMVFSVDPVGRARPLDTAGDCILVTVRLGQRVIELLAVHPMYPVRPEDWLADHERLAEVIARQRPALVVGDFNATFDHVQFQRYRNLGYRSATELTNAGWSPTWPAPGTRELGGVGLPLLVQIDHVLLRSSLSAVHVEHLELSGSDHRAVMAEVAPR